MAVHAPIIAGAACAPGIVPEFAAPTRRGMLAFLGAAPIAALPAAAQAVALSTADWHRAYRAFCEADLRSDAAYKRWDELDDAARDTVQREIYPTRPSCMRGPGCATLNDSPEALRRSWMEWSFYPGLSPDQKRAKVDGLIADIEAYRARVNAVMAEANEAQRQSAVASAMYESVMQGLIDTPAPDLSALAVKLELAIERNNEPLMEACLVDVKQFAASL